MTALSEKILNGIMEGWSANYPCLDGEIAEEAADEIEALSSKNEEQALAIRELVEVLERLSTFEAFTTEGWGFSHPEIVARVDFARAAIAKAKQP